MITQLSDQELEIYSRQIALEDIDYEGQLKIRNGRACLIGMGGLGSLIAFKLVAMGIGSLRMIDRDVVSRSDLHRQYLYDVDCLGLPKVEAAAKKLARLNPDVELEPVPASFSTGNAEELITGADVVLDGLDRPEPRYILNRTCNRLKIPYVFGAAIMTYGNVTTILPGQTICLECFMPGLKDEDLPQCAVVGVHPATLGIVTALQTYEGVRILTGQEPKLVNRLMFVDLSRMKFHSLSIDKRESCLVCGQEPEGSPKRLEDRYVEETCARDGRRNFIISPKQRTEINLDDLRGILQEQGVEIKASGALGITFERGDGVAFSILKDGTMVAQTPPRDSGDPRKKILESYRSILGEGLGLPFDLLPEE